MMARTTTIRTKRTGKKDLWIGLVGVVPNPGNHCFGDAKGAYVNVVTSATSAESFKRKVKRALDELDISLFEVENPEPLGERLSTSEVEKEILQMAETAREQDSVAFGTFHTYDNEEDG